MRNYVALRGTHSGKEGGKSTPERGEGGGGGGGGGRVPRNVPLSFLGWGPSGHLSSRISACDNSIIITTVQRGDRPTGADRTAEIELLGALLCCGPTAQVVTALLNSL